MSEKTVTDFEPGDIVISPGWGKAVVIGGHTIGVFNFNDPEAEARGLFLSVNTESTLEESTLDDTEARRANRMWRDLIDPVSKKLAGHLSDQ